MDHFPNHSDNHSCEFLLPPDEGLVCPVCRDVATSPHTTSCCKKLFCHSCLLGSRTHPHCPWCRQTSYTIQPRDDITTAIHSQHVYCSMRASGCGWTGPLKDLAGTHLQDGGCMFVSVTCPNGCGQRVPRGELDTHRHRSCPRRQFPCPHCLLVDTHEHVTTTHSALCKMYPVTCPHGCDTGSVERQHLESHVTRCPLALVRCTFPGCAEAMKRRDVAAHNEENTQRHLGLLSSAMAKMALSFEEKEVRQASLHRQEMESVRDRIRQLEQRVSDQSGPPVDFVMADYDRHSRNGDWWCSPAFRTHFRGYSMYLALRVKPKARQTPGKETDEGEEQHISMELRVNDDALNDHLVWPQWCTVRLEVLNQLEERHHHARVARGEVKRPLGAPSSRCWAEERFLPCSLLGYDAHRHTQYLKDDCLRIRVAQVRLQDTNFMYDA